MELLGKTLVKEVTEVLAFDVPCRNCGNKRFIIGMDTGIANSVGKGHLYELAYNAKCSKCGEIYDYSTPEYIRESRTRRTYPIRDSKIPGSLINMGGLVYILKPHTLG